MAKLTEYKIKIVDQNRKPMCNYPMVTRYAVNGKNGLKFTDSKTGVLTLQTNGNAVDIFITTPKEKNSEKTEILELKDGIKKPFDKIATFSKFAPQEIKVPHTLDDYGLANIVLTFYKNEKDKQLYTEPLLVEAKYIRRGENKSQQEVAMLEAKNGQVTIRPILFSPVSITPYHVDQTPFVDHTGKK